MDNSKWTLEDEIDYITEQIADGKDIVYNTSAHFSWLKELKDLREKIEDRRLIELPCKVGDIVYIIDEKTPCYACCVSDNDCHKYCTIDDKDELIVKRAIVWKIEINSKDSIDIYSEIIGTMSVMPYEYSFYPEDFGKEVFLTKTEAETKLQELRGGYGKDTDVPAK